VPSKSHTTGEERLQTLAPAFRALERAYLCMPYSTRVGWARTDQCPTRGEHIAFG